MKPQPYARAVLLFLTAVLAFSGPVVLYNNDNPNNSVAVLTGTPAGGIEHETGDDFLLSSETFLTGATFTGLIPLGAPLSNISNVTVEIYRVFPLDSDTVRTINVPTRANSPSDVEFDDRDLGAGGLTNVASVLSASFTALNSVQNGIHPSPGQTTGGEGVFTGEEVNFSVTFTTPFDLPAGHYFIVPQVELSSGAFLWLSATRPLSGVNSFAPDLQGWTRDANLAPDWLRVGTDIVGGGTPPTFNFAFSLEGTATPEPGTLGLLLGGLGLIGISAARRRRKK